MEYVHRAVRLVSLAVLGFLLFVIAWIGLIIILLLTSKKDPFGDADDD